MEADSQKKRVVHETTAEVPVAPALIDININKNDLPSTDPPLPQVVPVKDTDALQSVFDKCTYLIGFENPTVHKSLHHAAHTLKEKNFDAFLQKCGRPTGRAGLLDLPKVKQFDRDVTSLQLRMTCPESEAPDTERTYLTTPLTMTMDMAKRTAMKRCYDRISNKMYADWEILRGKLMQQLDSGFSGHICDSNLKLTSDTIHASGDSRAQVDLQVFNVLSGRDFKARLETAKKLSCDMCPQVREDLATIWELCIDLCTVEDTTNVAALLDRASAFLQKQFVAHMNSTVKKAPSNLPIGPRSDFHSLAVTYGMLFFRDPSFPSAALHYWFLVYVYVRSGTQIENIACMTQGSPELERVCYGLGRRDSTIFNTAITSGSLGMGLGSEVSMERSGHVDNSGGIFEELLVAYVNNQPLDKWNHWTAQDWLWFQLKQVEDVQGLSRLQDQVTALPASHFESGFYDVQLSLLTFQFSQGLSLLRARDPLLYSATIHLALLLQKCDLLSMPEPGPKLDLPGAFVEYSSQFGLNEQLRRLRVLDLEDRKVALERLITTIGNPDATEVLGVLEPDGTFHPGLLEKAYQEAAEPRQDFLLLCAKAGYSALEQGQYREALKLLYISERYEEVLTAMTRALRLPLRAPSASTWHLGLRDELRLFFRVFEVKGTDLVPGISQNRTWHTVRRLMAVDVFYEKCENSEDALRFFDQQHFFDQFEEDLLTEYPSLLTAYVSLLFTSFKSPPRIWPSLRDRVRALQIFLACNNSMSLSMKLQEDIAALALK